jgi:hypothetical protein
MHSTSTILDTVILQHIRLTGFTKDIIKAITAVDHEKKATIGPQAIIHIGSIIGSVVLLPA